MKNKNAIHPDLLAAQKLAYEPNRFVCSEITFNAESKEYGACSFELNGISIEFRVAKITPTKNGQFVTLWKRINDGPIIPYDLADQIDFFVVSVRSENQFGQFIFPKNLLWQKGYVSKNGIGGKLAMRVYPPWDTTESSQAHKTQQWQLLYFVEIQPTIDAARLQNLCKTNAI